MDTAIAINPRDLAGETVQTVDARDLHAFLEVGKDFTNWIKDRIKQYEFVEGEDFLFFANSGENSGRGRPAAEYHLTLDMAKELAMVERNARGRQARRYFIEAEKKWRRSVAVPADGNAASVRDLEHRYRQTLEQLVKFQRALRKKEIEDQEHSQNREVAMAMIRGTDLSDEAIAAYLPYPDRALDADFVAYWRRWLTERGA